LKEKISTRKPGIPQGRTITITSAAWILNIRVANVSKLAPLH
jgi:hypothetical protein